MSPIGRSQRFQHADFAAALEDGHHQGIDDPERSHNQREAAENSKQQVEHSENQPQIVRRVQQRKRARSPLA